MSEMIRQTQFSNGEVDIINWKRTDMKSYMASAQSLLNCEVGTTALARKRKGTTQLQEYNVTPYASFDSVMFKIQDRNGVWYLILAEDVEFTVFALDGTFLAQVDVPYLAVDLGDLDFTLDNGSLIISNNLYPPGRFYIKTTTPSLDFEFEYLDINPLPSYDFGNVNYNGLQVTTSGDANQGAAWTVTVAAPSDPGFTTDWEGGIIIAPGTSDVSAIGYARINTVTPWTMGSPTVTFSCTAQLAINAAVGPITGNNYSIQQPAFGPNVGYPASVEVYQNRLWFANTPLLKNTVFASKINGPTNFDVGIGRDTDAIVYEIGIDDSGAIVNLNGGKQFEIYCENMECVCPQDVNAALTPSTFAVRQQTSNGSWKPIKPITYLNNSYYVAKTGKSICEFAFEGVGLSYASANISLQSQHLVKKPYNSALIRGNDQSQDNFIYYANPDGTITTFQFADEFKLAALTPFEFGQNVKLIDLIEINNTLYLLKFYNLTGFYQLETLNNTSPVMMDNVSLNTMPDTGIITGLEDYNGYTVSVALTEDIEGFEYVQDYGKYLVQDGTITVDNPGAGGDVAIGMTYPVVIQPMYFYAGPTQTDFFKNVNQIYVDYFQSLDMRVNGQLINFQIFDQIQAGLPLLPQTGRFITYPFDGWNRDGTLAITQDSMFDIVITSISYQIENAII